MVRTTINRVFTFLQNSEIVSCRRVVERTPCSKESLNVSNNARVNSLSPNGGPLVISIKPCNPVLEEPEPSEPSPTDPPTDPHTEDTVGGGKSSVVEEAALKPEGFTEPQSEEALNEATEQASPTQTDHPKDGPTSSETAEEADHDAGTGKQAENKNQRMRIIGWINQKVKERHQKSIQKSFMKEMNYGYRLLSEFQQLHL